MADIYQMILRQLVTRGRLALLGFFSLLSIAIGFGIGNNDDAIPKVDGAKLIDELGLTFAVPLVCLVFATAALGDMYENGSLVYLWLKPIARWKIVAAATAAVITVAAPALTVGLTIASALTGGGGGGGLIVGTIIGTVLAVIAYSAVFTALGLVTQRALLWGIGYIVIIEGVVARFGLIDKIAIRSYSRSVVAKITDVDIDLGTVGLPIAIVVLFFIGGLGVAAGTARLSRMTIP
jgi:ABC-2 type transport system permease protein